MSNFARVSQRPLYVIIMTHVEGDEPEPQDSPTGIDDLSYQTGGLPPYGQRQRYATFELDLTGTEFLHQYLESFTDSFGRPARLFIEPTGEFWQTEGDSCYGGKLFRRHDYVAAGCEFGIQGHSICYSGESFFWYHTPPTEDGIRRKIADLHAAAERVWYKGRKVNAGLTFTGGHKLETGRRPRDMGYEPLDPQQAEWFIDHAAHELGYRVSFEDYDGHYRSKPEEFVGVPYPAHYLYEADYGDGVRMVKIDFNGATREDCPGGTARCENSQSALDRLDRTVAAQKQDHDASHLYYFAFTVHSNLWNEVHLERAGAEPSGEWAALQKIMRGLERRKSEGMTIQYTMPRTLAELFWNRR